MRLLAIDPGTTQSGYVVVDEGCRPVSFGKLPNDALLELIYERKDITDVAIEMIGSYGMTVGREVFGTCVWIGRFVQASVWAWDIKPDYVYRHEEKTMVAGNPRANDVLIKKCLIDMFAAFDLKTGKGTKADPDFFYGFKADVWQAFAVALTWMKKERRM